MVETKLLLGDCIERMKELPENSVDAIITDPPYELGFMNKGWDKTGIANNVGMWGECLRVLKPGGHLLSFSSTRTYHRMVCAIEDAGFEIRDMIEWVYGSGFPKSLNIGKEVDKLQGNEREQLGNMKPAGFKTAASGYTDNKAWSGKVTKGTSEWESWGTALKPAHEPICFARKPIAEKTIAKNCLEWGTGAINIDDCRVELGNDNLSRKLTPANGWKNTSKLNGSINDDWKKGRFPANLIHDGSDEVIACFPDTKKGHKSDYNFESSGDENSSHFITNIKSGVHFDDSGSAARFFKSIIYVSKASKKDRGKGNNHPTVKPTELMEYLVTMLTREGQTVLDPFLGSGTTGVACRKLNRNFIGIDINAEYLAITKKRIDDIEV